MISSNDQARYDRMAAVEEASGGQSTEGVSAHGDDAAAIGRQLLLEAMGSAEAVTRAVGRKPLDGGPRTGKAATSINLRVGDARKSRLEALREKQHRKNTSDLVRDAIDEYLERHERVGA